MDVLRGFALFGVFGANLMIFSGLIFLPDGARAAFSSGPDRIVAFLELFLVENKFMGLFSFLFGISFWLFLERVGARGAPATRLFHRRIGWLFVIGAIHGWVLWCFDILRFYALWAVLLPLFARVPVRRLLPLALSLSIVAPAVIAGVQAVTRASPAHDASLDLTTLAAFSTGTFREALAANWRYDWDLTLSLGQLAYQVAIFGRLLLGLCAVRGLDLAEPARHRTLVVRVLVAGILVGVPGNLVLALEGSAGPAGPLLSSLRRLLVEAGFLGFTLAFAAGLSLLFLVPRARRAVLWLAPLGQMALTAYLAQTLFGIWLFYGYPPGPHLMTRLGPGWLAVLWVTGYAAQILLARAWMRSFRFGPMEWIWRSLTWLELQPILRGTVSAQAPGRP